MPSLFADVDQTLVINLPDRADRRREMEAALRRSGETVGGTIHFFDATRPADVGGFPSLGAHGCFMSHLRALRTARDAGWGRVLILEDDAEPLANVNQAGPPLVAALEGREWDIAMLGVLRYGDEPAGGKGDAEREWLPLDRPIIGTQSYLARGEGLPKVIAALEAMLARQPGDPAGGPMHLDGAFYHLARDSGVRSLVARPSLFGQRSSRSDVADAKLVDRLPLVRNVVAALRKLRK